MYYVLKMGDELSDYHFIFINERAFEKAKQCAIKLKETYGHQYEVVKVETVWHTQTLAEIMER